MSRVADGHVPLNSGCQELDGLNSQLPGGSGLDLQGPDPTHSPSGLVEFMGWVPSRADLSALSFPAAF